MAVFVGLIFLTGRPAFGEWRSVPLGEKSLKNKLAVGANPSFPFMAAATSEQSFLRYDSGPAVYFPQSAVGGSIWAVRFTPLQSCSLVAFSVFSAGGKGAVRVHIFSDKSGLPAGELTSSFAAELGGNLTDQVIYLPLPVEVGGRDFHVALELLADGAPFVAGDDDGGSGHSSYFSLGEGWSQMARSDFVVWSFVRYYGPDQIPPLVAHTPLDAAFADEEIEIAANFSDFSGILEATLSYSVDGGAWVNLPMEVFGDIFKAQLTAVGAGSVLRYFIEVKDASGAENVSWAPSAGRENPFEVPVYLGRQIKYDDGSAESFFIANEGFDDNRFAVRLTPKVYPAQLHTLRAYVNDTARFFLSVYSDTDGSPGRLLSGPWKAGLKEEKKGWVNLILPAGSRPVFENGDFFLLLQWSSASPESPGVGADAGLPDGRSFFFTRKSGWKNWVYDDWMLRVSYVSSKASKNLPEKFTLEQNFPNPFNPSTEIRFRLEQPLKIELAVYNVLGHKVKTLASGSFSGGEHAVVWNGRDERGEPLSSGVYFYRLWAETLVQTRKMVLIK